MAEGWSERKPRDYEAMLQERKQKKAEYHKNRYENDTQYRQGFIKRNNAYRLEHRSYFSEYKKHHRLGLPYSMETHRHRIATGEIQP